MTRFFALKINPEGDKLTGDSSVRNYGTPVFLLPEGLFFGGVQ